MQTRDEHLDSGIATAVENGTRFERLDGSHGDSDGAREIERVSEWCLSVWRWWNEKARSAQGGFGHGLGFGARAGRAGRAAGWWRVPLLELESPPGFCRVARLLSLLEFLPQVMILIYLMACVAMGSRYKLIYINIFRDGLVQLLAPCKCEHEIF